MFEQKSHKNNKLWIALLVIIVLAAVMIVLEAQILVMLKDLQTSLFGSSVMDMNPLPPMRGDMIKDINPLPPMLFK